MLRLTLTDCEGAGELPEPPPPPPQAVKTKGAIDTTSKHSLNLNFPKLNRDGSRPELYTFPAQRENVMRILLLLIFTSTSIAHSIEISTNQGKLLVMLSHRSTQVPVFKHIPFAKPPLGARRWTHAEPTDSWTGVRDATRFGPACMQKSYPEDSFFFRPSDPTSEDCLHLNVWSTMPKDKNCL